MYVNAWSSYTVEPKYPDFKYMYGQLHVTDRLISKVFNIYSKHFILYMRFCRADKAIATATRSCMVL